MYDEDEVKFSIQIILLGVGLMMGFQISEFVNFLLV